MTIREIFNSGGSAKDVIAALKNKTISVPTWGGVSGLQAEYDPMMHPVMNKASYPDVVTDNGVEHVTRVTFDLQRLATKRMTELCCGIPVKRVYSPANDRQAEVAKYIEAILMRNRIDSVNVERLNMLFAGCEVMTLWYAQQVENYYYGFRSLIKLRCRNFSPMLGDELYPLFDEYGDMIALSVAYQRKVGKRWVNYFDAYMADRHVKFSDENGDWQELENEPMGIGKIPAVYIYRPTPIWENQSHAVYEMEWALSRNGNYLRKNSKPLFVVFADEAINYGSEKDSNSESRAVLQFPTGATANYVTWAQATESLKYHIDTLRSAFFQQLQLPDWSYEKMSQQALSGESRKQLFIDAQMKVRDESGRLLEAFDREVNVVKAFLKQMLTDDYASDIDALNVETVITPYQINDDAETINRLVSATGGKPIMSQREAIEAYGYSNDVDKTMEQIADEERLDALDLSD